MRWTALLALTACGSGGDPPPSATEDTDTTQEVTVPDEPRSILEMQDRHNYRLSGAIEVPHASTLPQSDLIFDWSGLTVDIWGRSLDASTVDQIKLYAFNQNADALAAQLSADSLDPGEALEIWYYSPMGRDSALTSDFSHTGNPFDFDYWFQVSLNHTFLVTLLDADLKLLSAATFKPGASERSIAFTDAPLNWTAELGADALITTEELGPVWTFDWVQLTVDAHGEAFDPLLSDQLFVAKLPTSDVASVALNIPDAADAYFVRYVQGQSSVGTDDLSALDGGEFTGFTAGDTWVAGMSCVGCMGIAPTVLAVVDVR